jgi:nitrile hydratase accessory protein
MNQRNSAPQPKPFGEPWHAQLFALTVHLNETGVFDWPEWAAGFSATLKRHGQHKSLDGNEDYYTAWLEALETLLAAKGFAAPAEVAALKSAWQQAYLHTPHGAPVRLADHETRP